MRLKELLSDTFLNLFYSQAQILVLLFRNWNLNTFIIKTKALSENPAKIHSLKRNYFITNNACKRTVNQNWAKREKKN